MVLFKIDTQADSALVDIDTDDTCLIKEKLKEYLILNKDYYYVNGLIEYLRRCGFKVEKVIPINIHWWEIQPNRDTDKIVEKILESE